MNRTQQHIILDHFLRLGKMHDFHVEIVDFEEEIAAISREFAGKREYQRCKLNRSGHTVGVQWLNEAGEKS